MLRTLPMSLDTGQAARRSAAKGLSMAARRAGVARLLAQPGRHVLFADDHRHAVVQGRHQAVGCCGDDGAGQHGWAVLGFPLFPQAGEGHGAAVAQGDGEGLLVGFAPFKERACGNDAAPARFPGVAEGGLVGEESARALWVANVPVSFDQGGTRPQRMSTRVRRPSFRYSTGINVVGGILTVAVQLEARRRPGQFAGRAWKTGPL